MPSSTVWMPTAWPTPSILDLTEINDLGYYTGLTFEALAPGQGFSLAGGGRYDHLVETFGDPQPAVGVALGVDRLLLARTSSAAETSVTCRWPPQLLVNTGDSAACVQWVRHWREQGNARAGRCLQPRWGYALGRGAAPGRPHGAGVDRAMGLTSTRLTRAISLLVLDAGRGK